jgi:subtilisin-like proprotein convertase family protein
MKLSSVSRWLGLRGVRGEQTRSARRKPPVHTARLCLVHLEERVAPAVLPPVIVNGQPVDLSNDIGAVLPPSPSTSEPANETSPTVAIDPLNPQHAVAAWVLNDPSLPAASQQRIFVEAAITTNGGQTWSKFFVPNNMVDPATTGSSSAPYQQAVDPNVAIDRNGNIYLLREEVNTGNTNGAIVLDVFNPQASGTLLSNQVIYRWNSGFDEALNPFMALDTNVPSFTDPVTHAVQTDPFSGSLYVAWHTQDTAPTHADPVNFNPNTIRLVVSSPINNQNFAGQNFSGQMWLNNGINFGTDRDGHPALAIQQGTADGRIAGGNLVAVWSNFGFKTAPGEVVGSQVSAAASQTFFSPDDGKAITDALAGATGTQPFQGSTTNQNFKFGQAAEIDIPVGSAVPGGQALSTDLTNITVQLNILANSDNSVRITLIAPDGKTSAILAQADGGPGPNFVNTVFDDAGATSITTASAPCTGTFKPFQLMLPLFQGKVDPNGTWKVIVENIVSTDPTIGVFQNVTLNITTASSIKQTTTYQIPVSITNPNFTTLSNLEVTLNLKHPNLSQLQILLVSPNNTTITLVNNRIDETGASKTGVGITGTGMGIFNGTEFGTTFDDNAPRSITDTAGSNTNFLGMFVPELGAFSVFDGLTAAQLAGTWKLEITDFVHDTTTPMQLVQDVKLVFTSGGKSTNVSLPGDFSTAFVAYFPVLGSVSDTYALRSSASPTAGIGPHVVVASDNTLGSFSAFQGRIYAAWVDAPFAPPTTPLPLTKLADSSIIVMSFSDDGGKTWSAPTQVNDDNPQDGFSEGNRPHLMPQVAVDPTTGTLVVSWLDARNDASRARVADYLTTSIDGGHSFSPQTYVEASFNSTDAITNQTIAVQPIPENPSGPVNDSTFGYGNQLGLAVLGGHILPVWAGNENGMYIAGFQRDQSLDIFSRQVSIAAGPRVVDSTMGAIATQTVQELNGTPITFNNQRTADGVLELNGFIVTFDRNIDVQSFTAGDVTVIYRSPTTPGGQPGTVVTVGSIVPLTSTAFSEVSQNGQGTNRFLVLLQTAQSATGTYSYSVGPNIRDLVRTANANGTVKTSGNAMDQNHNAVTGELQDTYAAPSSTNGVPFQIPFVSTTFPLIVPGPHLVTTYVPGNPVTADNLVLNKANNAINVVFDRKIDASTFTSAQVLSIVGPAGLIPGPYTVIPNPNGNEDPNFPFTFQIKFPFLPGSPNGLASGTYVVQLGTGIKSKNGDLVDQNQNAGLDSLRSVSSTSNKTVAETFTSNTPAAILTSSTATATLDVTDSFAIKGLTIQLNITSTRDSDLIATLVAPDGTSVRLFTNLSGSSGTQGFAGTILDDNATTPIQLGLPPYNGVFNPQTPLLALLNHGSSGTWQLLIQNTSSTNISTLTSWSLTFQKSVPGTGLGEGPQDSPTASFRIFNSDPTGTVGQTYWSAVGPAASNSGFNSGTMTAVAADLGDTSGNTVYAGGQTGGLWKTTNFLTTSANGPTWIPLTDFGPGFSINIGAIAIFDRNNDTKQSMIFAGTGDPNSNNGGAGIIRSLDGGLTWTLLDSTTNVDSNGNILPFNSPLRDHIFVGQNTFKITIDPVPTPGGDAIIYAAIAGSHGGLYKSTDSGKRWTHLGLTPAGQPATVTDVVLAPASSATNPVTTTLNGTINASQTTITVVSGAGIANSDVLLIDSEQLKVTGGGGSTSLTVIRGFNGTTASAHANGTQVTDPKPGNLQVVYAAVLGTGVFISPNQGATWNLMAGGIGDPLIEQTDQGQAPFPPVPVNGAPLPNGGKGRIVLATPALTGNLVEDKQYEGWLYALVVTSSGDLDGLYMTKDFGQNWTSIHMPVVTATAANGSVAQSTSNNKALPNINPFGNPALGFHQGASDVSFLIDPNNPNVVYIGGSNNGARFDINGNQLGFGLVRVDVTHVWDAHNMTAFDNQQADGGAIMPSTQGPIAIRNTVVTQFPTDLEYGLADQVVSPGTTLNGAIDASQTTIKVTSGTDIGNNSYILIDSEEMKVIAGGGTNELTVTRGILGTTAAFHSSGAFVNVLSGTQAGYYNLLRDPNNPFLANSTIFTLNVGHFTNDGSGAVYSIMDFGPGTPANEHQAFDYIDPLTGLTRLIFVNDAGVYTGLDDGTGSAVQSLGTVAQIFGARTGNLQTAQFFYGTSQPSSLAAQLSGALFYASGGHNRVQSAANVLSTGNLNWTGPEQDSFAVATDQAGSGTVYDFVRPEFQLTSNFFQVTFAGSPRTNEGATGRTFGLLTTNPDPQWNGIGDYFAVNPVSGKEIVVSSNVGRVFRTQDQGVTWFDIGDPVNLDGANAQALAFGAPDPNSDGNLDNYILAGTTAGHIFVTFTGGGSNGTNGWINLSKGLDNSPVEFIVADPVRGSHDAYAVTANGVFFMADTTAANATWVNITGNLFSLMRNAFGSSSFQVQALTSGSLRALAADWRFQIKDNVTLPNSGTHPVLYVGGLGGVFRSTDKGQTWTFFPSTAGGAAVNGGLFPDVQVTSLTIADGNINPITGQPDQSGGPDVLLATTFGRGTFAIRLPHDVGSGPRVVAFMPPNTTGPISSVTVTFAGSVDISTFASGSFVVFHGPNGDIPLNQITVTDLDPTSHKVFQISFPTQTTAGIYTIGFGPNVRDFSSDVMDQNNNGINGEVDDAFTGHFVIAPNSAPPELVVGADASGGPEVKVFSELPPRQKLFDFYAYDPHFLGGVRVALGDVTGDGFPDIVTAPGAGGGPDIRVFDGATGQKIDEFMAYSPLFTGGVFVAVADVNGDGFADIITAAGAGGGPEVKVFSGKDGHVIWDFMAYSPFFNGGVSVAAGDVNGDGFADIVTGAGPGGGPHVEIFSGKDLTLLESYYAFSSTFNGGVNVALSDVLGTGRPDVVAGQATGQTLVNVFDGVNAKQLASFFAFNPLFLGGVRVGGIADLNNDFGGDILVAAGPSGGPQTIAYDGLTHTVLDSFYAFNPFFGGGVYVGGG